MGTRCKGPREWRQERGGSNLLQVTVLFGLGEGEEDLSEGRMEDVDGELLQVVVEGVGDEEVKDGPGQQ